MVSSVSSVDTSSLTALQKLLAEADTNADSVISESELKTALSSDGSAAAALVSEADGDGDGAVSLSEFASFAEKFATDTGMALLSAQEGSSALTSLFTELDSDGSATLTADEVSALLTASTEEEESATTDETTTEETTTTTSTETATGISITTDVEELLSSVDATGDGVYDKTDTAKLFLDAEQAAAKKRAEQDSDADTKLFTAATSALDTDKDGIVSDEEKTVYS